MFDFIIECFENFFSYIFDKSSGTKTINKLDSKLTKLCDAGNKGLDEAAVNMEKGIESSINGFFSKFGLDDSKIAAKDDVEDDEDDEEDDDDDNNDTRVSHSVYNSADKSDDSTSENTVWKGNGKIKVTIPGKIIASDGGYTSISSWKWRYATITVTTGEEAGTYRIIEGLATSKVKEIANTLEISYKSSWSAHQIAKQVLETVLGSKFKKPERGQSGCVLNAAIFDGFLLLHDYDNDGFGNSDSIKIGCYIYKKIN